MMLLLDYCHFFLVLIKYTPTENYRYLSVSIADTCWNDFLYLKNLYGFCYVDYFKRSNIFLYRF